MHKLARHVRFSVNPFLSQKSEGYNSYASNPPGEGLAIFLELGVELLGEVEPSTGFVINVLDIDKQVRQSVVPVFAACIKRDFGQGKHIGLLAIGGLLKSAWTHLADKFGPARLNKLSLALNPFRRVTMDDEDCDMIYLSEKFEFAAMHKLWNDRFSEQRNLELFGRCANPAGHGHNYIVEVTVKLPANQEGFRFGAFEKIVDDEFVRLVDHKNLNADVAELAGTNPTVENMAVFAWKKLTGKFDQAALHCVTLWETDKTFCSYYGQ
ncbi:MAG: 6-pyruvoyl trahydropterin synthase family protein [Planctomycetota bacterium]|jgi:6-pyruvoyltetrahydropterin/6-carboxytetrahydropterin synthase